MLHLTLNTGHARQSPRSEVQQSIIDLLRPLLVPGEHPLPMGLDAYRLVAPSSPAGFVGTVYRGPAPLVTIGVARTEADADAIWPGLKQLYLRVTDRGLLAAADFAAPQRPSSTPWCAAVLVGPLGDAAGWIGDFERCLAWTWLDSCAPQS